MTITIWEIFKYIYKWKTLIVLITCAALAAAYLYVGRIQTFHSEIIIRYEDFNNETGLTNSGKEINVYEILSPNIIAEALDAMDSNQTVESVRSSMSITPIIPSDVSEIQEAKLKSGEEYSYYPNEFSIKYADHAGNGSNYVRDLLDAIIKNYTVYFSEKYLNQLSVPEIDFDVQNGSHDYLEIAEIFSEHTEDAITNLSELANISGGYRSPATGFTFSDLTTEYTMFKNYDLPTLFSDILRGQITQNEELLLKNYTYRRDQFYLNQKNETEKSDLALDLMRKFAKSNEDVPNSYNYAKDNANNDNIDTTDVVFGNEMTKSKTTYDELVNRYVTAGVEAIAEKSDGDYCQYILDVFSSDVDPAIDRDALLAKITDEIGVLRNEWDRLTKLTTQTISDYNAYCASQNISYVSGVDVRKTVNLQLYLIIAFILGFSLSVILALTFEITKKMRNFNTQEQEQIQ